MARQRKTAQSTSDRAELVKALSAKLDEFEAGLDDESLAEILAMHDGYSPRNATLIAMQRPDATDVSGYQKWLDRGRQVRKGEHGIKILAPAGQSVPDESVPAEERKAGRKFFRLATVFDVSQTEKIEKPERTLGQLLANEKRAETIAAKK